MWIYWKKGTNEQTTRVSWTENKLLLLLLLLNFIPIIPLTGTPHISITFRSYANIWEKSPNKI